MQTPEKYELSPLKLWSPLQRHLADNGQTKGTPQQWIGSIRNLQKKGVSSVEIEWSKIVPMLEVHPAPLLRVDELLGFLGDHPPCELVLQHHVTDEYVPLIHYEKQPRPQVLPPKVVRRGRHEVRVLHYRDRVFGLCIWLNIEFDSGLFGRHSYWSFSVPRGRKKLASHPVTHDFASAQEAMAYGRTLVARMARRLAAAGFVGQIKSINRFPIYALPGGEQYTEWLITAPNLFPEYFGPHFDLPNIVAHVRTTLRTTPKDERLLVLEEIQSDWNQALREAIQEARTRQPMDDDDIDLIEWDDDMDPPPFNPYRNHWLEAALRMMLLLAANKGFAGIAWLPGKLHAERFPWADADGLTMFYDRIVLAAVEKLAKSWGMQLSAAQFPTLSRHFRVRKVAGTGKWRVLNLASGQIVSDEFSNQYQAEAFRRSKENPVMETVPALYVPDEMRADILKYGLPYLGAVGKRPSTTGNMTAAPHARTAPRADAVR